MYAPYFFRPNVKILLKEKGKKMYYYACTNDLYSFIRNAELLAPHFYVNLYERTSIYVTVFKTFLRNKFNTSNYSEIEKKRKSLSKTTTGTLYE